jgi:uncharacterized protein YggE
MKKLIFMAALLVAGSAAAQQAPIEGGVNLSYSYENAVQVTGRAERKVTPDEIYVRIVIRENELKSKKTVEQAEQDMIAALKNFAKIDTDKNLTLDRMSSDYKNYFLRPGQARASATYELKVGSAQELGLAYQALEQAGIANMNITRQTHSKLREIQSELRVEAMKDAKRMALDLMNAVGQKVGPAVYVSDYGAGGGVAYMRSMDMAAEVSFAGSAAPAYETPLQLSDLNLTYNVSVKFALEK